MTATLDNEVADLRRANAELQRRLAAALAERDEALKREAASTEVLQVINSSPGDLAPVFDAMLERAMRLCEAPAGYLLRYEAGKHFLAAGRGISEALTRFMADMPQPAPQEAQMQILADASYVHVHDLGDSDAYRFGTPLRRAAVDLGGLRTGLAVPLFKDGQVLGNFCLARYEVRPFTDKQIALLQNFAAQAVIAMEIARLITETQEALEQQTATAEVLQVINSSPGNLAPVFDAILEKAHTLCGAAKGALVAYDGERYQTVATRGLSEAYKKLLREVRRELGPTNSPSERLLRGESFVQILDLATTNDQIASTATELEGARTVLFMPLRKDGALLGYMTAYRQEVLPFSDKQIALLQNFAAQAVIAMENARLITETREALEQQTATAEVLQVINSSPGDLAPVFDAILEKAHSLCGAAHGGLNIYDGERFRNVAAHAIPPRFAELMRQPFHARPIQQRLLRGERYVHVPDMMTSPREDPDDPIGRASDEAGIRTLLVVPLRKDGALLGYITAHREEVRPFTEKQIALLENFAAQAVIAMENARLLTETREALEQQTATAEVLQVINSSPGDLAPVFDALLEKAVALCDAGYGVLRTFDGELFHLVAMRGEPDAVVHLKQLGAIDLASVNADDMLGRIVRGEAVVHIADIRETHTYRDNPVARERAEAANQRTWLAVALRKDAALLGVIMTYRPVVRPFTDKQVALLQNFAAQAVIAMENARLITETREALEQQTATAELLKVINSSTGNIIPVFNALVDTAARLCNTSMTGLAIRDGDAFRYVATRSLSPQWVTYLNQVTFRPGRGTVTGRALLERRVIHVTDIAADPEHALPDAVTLGDLRTMLAVPLLRENEPIGVLGFARQHVEPFTDRQIALAQTFATQAVIAMENARLITETREALEQQTATAEVLQVINSSPGDLGPVFDAMLERATRLCEAEYGLLGTYGPEGFRGVAALGLPMGSADALSRIGHPPAGTSLGRVERTRETVQIVDITQEPAYAEVFKVNPWLRQVRSNLVVPLLKDDELIGVFILFRGQVRPFTDKQIALVQNFAAQAVIAMENARLLNEIRQRQAELRVTFDNMVDGVAMFDEELRLAAWNRNFQQLLDLPDEFVAKRHGFDAYIRYLTERGEFGETDPETQIKRLRDRLGDHYSFERTRPDGTVIEVRHNPMPDGGVVLIYSDITERKRSEAEIRAARDAAETAYRDLKTAQASLVQAEKMASLGQLTAGIAHEIKNPLNFVNNFAGLSVELLDELKETTAPVITALDDAKRAEIDETIEMLTGNLEKIAEHGRRADNIVKSMLEHSRGSSGERRTVDLNGLIEEALNLAYHGGRAQDQSFNVTLERDYAEAMPPIELVPQDITRVCLNLFTNGFYATTKRQREGGDASFRPTLKVLTRDLGDAVEISIRDNGIGIPPEIKDKLFQPFFTTKPTGEGTGLGLSISYDIVTQQHGGTITVDSRVGEFTEFTVRLPRAYRATIAEAAS